MSSELQPVRYEDRIATVIGGRGQLGSKIVRGLEELGMREVRVCEKEDPLRDFVRSSTDLFFAIDAEQTRDMLQATRDLLTPKHSVLDGSSVKPALFSIYRELDTDGVSVCSTHVGAVPSQPLRGIPVWLCTVGPNSEEAKRLATDLYLAKNASIRQIDIEEHPQVEKDQWFTFAGMHVLGAAFRRHNLKLEQFNRFATLNAELLTLPLGRSLGQGIDTPSEILFTQPRKEEFFEAMQKSLKELGDSLNDRDKLKEFMQANIDFHDDPEGFVKALFRKAGIIGARNANLRMYAFSFRTYDDDPGKLIALLRPFYKERANLTAIDSMAGVITPQEEERGIDPDRIVDFDIGIDPKTINPKKAEKIKEALRKMGCVIEDRPAV